MTALKYIICLFSIVLMSTGTAYGRTPDKAKKDDAYSKDKDPNKTKGLEGLVLQVRKGTEVKEGDPLQYTDNSELRENSTAAKDGSGQNNSGSSNSDSSE